MKEIRDKDLITINSVNEENIVFYNVKDEPFDLYGLAVTEKGELFSRMPSDAAKRISPNVEKLCKHTSGGRVRFKTNSPYVAIVAKYQNIFRMNHMSLLGSSGFDMYTFEKGVYKYAIMRRFIPPMDLTPEGYESIQYFKNNDLKDITINFPLYNDLLELYIGIEKGSILTRGEKYVNDKPIVCYGSSIAQGACASRPGNSYMGMISRKLNCDFINLGFSGSAKGEKEMAEYIASLDISAFVCEYDQDADSAEYLKDTHPKFIEIIREKHPDIPIILMSSILRVEWEQEEYDARKKVILETYDYWREKGDENIYYLDCQHVFDRFGGDNGITDGSHPNDLGFMCMADAISEILKKAMNI